jgi:NAD(P)-dependent dehydrogenase (short-subunit alcohol dehydrogenase family)
MTTPQKPINSGYGMRTDARDAIGGRDLTGKVAIVTGGYSGLGLETTKALAAAGAIVIVPARSAEKAQQALVGIPNVEQAALDLADPKSIDAFAGGFLSRTKKLDILINNAAIMASPLMRDAPRLRGAIRHQPSRPFPTHPAALARAQSRRPWRARRVTELDRPPHQPA